MKKLKAKAGAQVEVVTAADIFSAELVKSWLRFLRVSKKTVETYNVAVRQMFKYFNDNNITRPAREDLENWLDELINTPSARTGKKMAPATIQLYLTGCRLFFQWLAQKGLYADIAAHLKSGVRLNHNHKRGALTAIQSAQLFKAVGKIFKDELKIKQLRAILALSLSTGCRSIELERANIENLRRDNGIMYLFVQGKGHSSADAQVKIDEQVYAVIQDYLQARAQAGDDISGNAPLFSSCARRRNFGARISTQTIRKDIRRLLDAIGLKDRAYSQHSLRHTAITQALLNGATLTQAQQMARHSNINTTLIYNHSLERMKNNAELYAANALFGALDTLNAQMPDNAHFA